jgi:hypothetical protein
MKPLEGFVLPAVPQPEPQTGPAQLRRVGEIRPDASAPMLRNLRRSREIMSPSQLTLCSS